MSQFWSEFVHGLEPYVPGEQPAAVAGLVKLNTNENPYGPSPRALAAMRAALGDDLRLYPDPESSRLRAAIGEYYGVPLQQVFVGNGSDEVLAHVFNGLLRQREVVLFTASTPFTADCTALPAGRFRSTMACGSASTITACPTAASSSPIPMRRPVACCRCPTSLDWRSSTPPA